MDACSVYGTHLRLEDCTEIWETVGCVKDWLAGNIDLEAVTDVSVSRAVSKDVHVVCHWSLTDKAEVDFKRFVKNA